MVNKRTGDLVISITGGVIAYIILELSAMLLSISNQNGIRISIPSVEMPALDFPIGINLRFLGLSALVFVYILVIDVEDEEYDLENVLPDKFGVASVVILYSMVAIIPVAYLVFTIGSFIGLGIKFTDVVYSLLYVALIFWILADLFWDI